VWQLVIVKPPSGGFVLFTRLLIPVDFSEPSREALKLGVTVAMRVGARLTLLFVDSATIPQSSDKIARALKRWIAEDVPSSVHAEILVLRGSPAEQINQQASRGEHDLVVMGTHGKQGLERIVLGSVAETVVRTCPVPVLVTHDRG
jgi:nucleotide-binding universal stress UspA family protein